MICSRYFGGGICRCTSRLDGLVVIITGGNSGIGRALALQLVNKGRTVTVYLCMKIAVGVNVYLLIHFCFIKFHFVTSRFNFDLSVLGNSKFLVNGRRISWTFL